MRGRKTFLLSFRGAPAWVGVCTEAGADCLYTEPASSCFAPAALSRVLGQKEGGAHRGTEAMGQEPCFA